MNIVDIFNSWITFILLLAVGFAVLIFNDPKKKPKR